MAQDKIAKYEIQDTGLEVIGGSVVHTRASTNWINLRGASLQPNINYSTDGYQSSKKDYVNDKWTYESNRVTSKAPVTFTVPIAIPKDSVSDFQAVLNMGDTFGLKKIKGGFGLIDVMPESIDNSGTKELYCIIKAINPNESFANGSASLYRATITFEVVVA